MRSPTKNSKNNRLVWYEAKLYSEPWAYHSTLRVQADGPAAAMVQAAIEARQHKLRVGSIKPVEQ